MNEEEILRKEAASLYLQGVSIKDISAQPGRSRQWVHKWIKQYETFGLSESWYKSGDNTPKQVSNKVSPETEKAVINIRKELLSEPYQQTGAINILYKLDPIGIQAPSTATINRIIKRNGLENREMTSLRKETEYPTGFVNVQQMDLIGPRYLKGGFKFYFFSIMDVDTHYAHVYPVKNKSAKSIVPCLVDFWSDYQLPDFLQMDNELSFRGSNKHPRSLGLLLKVALSNGITPIFIPPAEPWRNGLIEKFNDNVQKRFYAAHTFSDFEQMRNEATRFSDFHNRNHRYSCIGYKTPEQVIEPLGKRFRLSPEWDINANILIEEGSLIFIRFVRSDRKLLILDSVFTVDEELKYSSVIARIIIEKYVLMVSRNNIIYHIFPFPMFLPK
jgi:putative transposase